MVKRANQALEPTRAIVLSFRKIIWTSNINSRVAHLQRSAVRMIMVRNSPRYFGNTQAARCSGQKVVERAGEGLSSTHPMRSDFEALVQPVTNVRSKRAL